MEQPLTHSGGDAVPARRYWCERAYLDGGFAAGVTVDVADDGTIAAVTAATTPGAGAVTLRGVVLPGLANAHSHAFHRALRGRTHDGNGSFWTWRDQMYRAANRLDPDRYHRLARGVFGEMLLAGITTVGEFHYVHHQPDGTPYADANAMGEALVAAAGDVGLRITLLDTLYLYGGLDATAGLVPLGEHQRRFGDGTAEAWAARVDSLASTYRSAHAGVRIGAAIHSVRAAAPDDIAAAAASAAGHDMVLHVHVSEQPGENDACAAYYGRSPIAVLCDAGVGPAATFVHATHVTDADIAALGASGGGVCICPSTERDLGDGLGPARRFADASIPLSLGTDAHTEIDLLGEARALELDERLRLLARGVFGADELFAAASAHRSLGWRDVGAIAPGSRADLVALDVTATRWAGVPIEPAAVLMVAGAADVTDVVVDGRHLVSGGTHRSIDIAAELATEIEGLFAP